MRSINKIQRSIRFALKGLRHAYRVDESFRLELHYGIPVYGALIYLLSPLTQTEWVFVVLSYVLILIVELLNTSIEELLDKLHPERHETIERSKDIASAAVLMSFLFSSFVFLTIWLT